MGNVICVATWGNPQNWGLAEYASDQKRIRAFSTLNFLHEIEKPAKTIIIVLDTLADPDKLEKCELNYSCIEDMVKEDIRRYLCGIEAEILVLPGVLTKLKAEDKLKEYVVFSSEPNREFLPLLIYELYSRLLNTENELEIALDISHGINFMPTLAYRAATEVATALAAAKVQQVRLRVYQADPYPELPPDIRKKVAREREGDPCRPVSPEATPPVVRYNRIAEATFKPWNLSRYLTYEGSGEKVLTDTRECDLGNIRELLGDVLLLLGAYRLGALLQLDLLAKTIPIEDVEFAMRSAVECWRRKRIVNRSEGSLEIKSGTRFSTGFYALLHAHAVLKGVKRLLGNSSDEASATFDEINKLRRLMEGSTVVKVLVDREISKLKRIWEKGQEKGSLSSDWKLYADLLSEKAESEPEQEESEDMFQRNFIAHAGFHSKVVELRLKNDQLELRVRPSEWEMVKKVLRTVVREQ